MTKPFGHFWETVHQASGEVTETGFTREAMAVGEFPHDICGYFLRVRALELTSTPPPGAAVKAEPVQHLPGACCMQGVCAQSTPQPPTAESGQTNEQGRAADVAVSGKQQVIDALYAAWMREPVGETVGAIGNAIQYLQSEASQPPSASPVAVPLEDIEQYRMQMAGISTAALGYWKEGDSIHPDYDTLALRDVAKLYVKYDRLFQALWLAGKTAQPALPDAGLDSQRLTGGNKMVDASPALLVDIDYAIKHGWPKDSIDRITYIREADKKRAAIATSKATS